MLPSILAKQLEKGIGEYIETTYPMVNEPFRGSLRDFLVQQNSVYHAPYMAVRLPFRVAESMPTCFEAVQPAYLPYVHQQKAFARLAVEDCKSTLVATGTGSGKTECFLYPILDYCYRHKNENGIKAMIIYPMNALAADQARRIAELIYNNDKLRGNVNVGMYVGGQGKDASRVMSEHGVITDHETMLNHAPDILLTNYKMLDYLLVRPKDALLWQDNTPETLKYIAVDELHTFDGAQGTDLACLLRRLKHRLGIQGGQLCCIGTSATMGSEKTSADILEYASEIFGEIFEKDAIITEDRLSPAEFFAGVDTTEFATPTPEALAQLDELVDDDEQNEYLRTAAAAFLPGFDMNPEEDADAIELGQRLMHHGFFQAVIRLTGGKYYQAEQIAKELAGHYPVLAVPEQAKTMINALFALISHARTGAPGKTRPFLNVQVQLWMRELRRLLAKVDPENVTYNLDHDLNRQQARQYLPVVNCRDCGTTGWTAILNERSYATMANLSAFYNLYFRADDKVVMMFPYGQEDTAQGQGLLPARICPDCLFVKIGADGTDECPSCGTKMVNVQIPSAPTIGGKGKGKKYYVCPFCHSTHGLALVGLRSATEISASISQMFASQFNDDEKTLAFSDNVQDAAHRAGFFNSRTWRFGLRTAIQRYCQACGDGQSLADYQQGFISYWHEQMRDEAFVSYFIGPNMTWQKAYEEMIEQRKLGNGKAATNLIRDVEQRAKYEIMLEYGLGGKVGRTLEKSSCSVLAFDDEDIRAIAAAVRERAADEFDMLRNEPESAFLQMVLGFLYTMRINGAFLDDAFNEYTRQGGNSYLLTNERNRWLPGQQAGRNIPRFLANFSGNRRKGTDFDTVASGKYTSWIEGCCNQVIIRSDASRDICQLILEESVKRQVVGLAPAAQGYKIYGLDKAHVFITRWVVQMRCDVCGAQYAFAAENAEIMENAPCLRRTCRGRLAPYHTDRANYYGRLFSGGKLARINAREHTGLLERAPREQLEEDFKRDPQELWDPNVLSCTPTLEMGIDIGDLSSVILCSMPPAQSQFLQRAGRAGRKNGNALTLAVANARPHDLYFYADPLEMIDGTVVPPKIFLRASAVLERQFVAFCMDSWVKTGLDEKAIPDKVGVILNNLERRPANMFPFNFLDYVQRTETRQLHSFMQMFAAYLDDGTREELTAFARGTDSDRKGMQVKLLDAFEELKKQRDALSSSVQTLKDMIHELEAKPKDRAYDDEIKELKQEQNALIGVMQEISRKNVFNFLSDEGLLPNYAFPEAGVILRAVLYRKEDEEAATSGQKKKYEKMVYEYSRSASSAISEFAPNNNFYVEGRKLKIDQVDLTTAQSAKWRLCPNCSHAQIEETGKHTAACPQCGSPAWADAGQVRDMLKVQMVYSTMDYTKSLIGDESDDRTNVFYCRQLLVDVDEDHDISSAYRMDNEEFPFGYEFVRKAVLREINFGESDMTGERLTVCGVEDVRKGFRICKYCGKVQPEFGKPEHTFACKTRKMPAHASADAYQECLFLYREFTTEILRLLIPATTNDTTCVKTESFVAAFMLGMKEKFGNVDHLRATVSEVPVPDADYRKQYLVVYDSIPGGTGYLKQLMHEDNALIDVFEKALAVMENCSCKDDPTKDGCYHCLFAYRQSKQIGNISRRAAMSMLKSILSGKSNVQKIDKLNSIKVNPLFDSELEQMFMDAVRQKVGAANVTDAILDKKHSYHITLGDIKWELEPQVMLDAADGVKVACKPDFVFWPKDAPGHKPVAVFTDGFAYHKDKAADDTLKREAIRRSGDFRVWALSYQDVQDVFMPQGGSYADVLNTDKMPSGITMYDGVVKKMGAAALEPKKMTAFDLLIAYLRMPDAEQMFTGQARAYAYSLLEAKLMNNSIAFTDWKATTDSVNVQTHYTDTDFVFADTFFGSWTPEKVGVHLRVYAGARKASLRVYEPAAVCAVLDDNKDSRTDKYQHAWNNLWNFWNVMQFAKEFVAVSTTGMEQMVYTELPVVQVEAELESESVITSEWDNVRDMLIVDDAKAFAEFAAKAGFPAPDESDVGYEVEGDNGEIIATAEIAWPAVKLAFMTDEQLPDRERLETLGWRIITLPDVVTADVNELFGGIEK